MSVLVLVFLVLTGGAVPVGDGATANDTTTVTTPVATDGTTGDTTTAEGGDTVRKSPIN